MKSVVGQLRFDLAQYNELEAFSKFGSDLDKTTKAQLLRGEKIVEVLKQGENVPLPVERQIFITFMVNNGYLDEIETKNVIKAEQELYSLLEVKYHQFTQEIIKSGITDEIREKMHGICKEVVTLVKE